MAALASLIDPFTDAAFNSSLWNGSTGGAVSLDTVSKRAILACPTVSGTTNTLGANGPFDGTGSALYAQVAVCQNGNGSTRTVMKLTLDANNSTTIAWTGGVFTATAQSAGVTTTYTLPAYDSYQHGWWRLREASANWYAETSPDGWTWTTRATMPYTWSPTAVTVAFQAGVTGTEPAGMFAAISHVNTVSGGPRNMNWPLVEDAWAPYWNCNGGDSPLDRYVEVTHRTRGSNSSQRGRQYEVDQVRSGEYTTTLVNNDGSLDPVNAAGPWSGHIVPFQPYRKRAQWPPTINMLTQVQATGGDLGGQPLGALNAGNAGPSIFTQTDTTGQIVASGTAWQGANVLQFSVPSTTTANFWICYTPQPGVIPGQTYTVQLRVRNITAASSVQVAANFQTANTANASVSSTLGTTTTLTGSPTAAWTTITATGMAGATAALMYTGVRVIAAPGTTCNVQVDGWMLEKSASASAWVQPGIWYPMFAGFVERWPQQWTKGGTYGTVQPAAGDALSLLSQRQLQGPLAMEINSHSPRFFFPLNDPAGAQWATDATGAYPPAPTDHSKFGLGSQVFGTAVTAADPVNGVYTGSGGTVSTFDNPNPGTNLQVGAAFISLTRAGITGPANVSGAWTRMFAFRYTGPLPSSAAILWSSLDRTRGGGSRLYWQIVPTTGRLQLMMSGPTNNLTAFEPSTASVADSNWHLVVASYSHANAQIIINLDGTSTFWGSFNPLLEPTGLVSDSVGAWIDPTVGNGSAWNYKGDLAFVAEFPTALTGTDCTNLYNAWKNSCTGESTDARYQRILRYSGYIGPSSVQTGLTTSMGPAKTDGQDAVSALQAVVDTENGAHFVDRAGTITFRARSARYNATTPVYTFGERADLGEWPYEDCTFDYDSTHLGNTVTVTQDSTGQVFNAQDATSIKNYFPRTMTRTVNSTSVAECQDATSYLLSRYKQPTERVSTLRLHPSAMPALWITCLSLELGTRVRIMRRPPGEPAIQVEAFIEQIQVDMDDGNEAHWTLQCSPADVTPYGIFAAWHTTLNATIASGVSSIVVNASQDTVNPLAVQLCSGQQLVLGQNTANQETVTVSAVGATSSGWTTATITLTAATTKAHIVGDLINEPLPAGVTDPTAFDASSAFDSSAFAY
ncbi:hypothetical protein QMK19_03735 [Streptomyces sp. H10-C2]|uniref:hypothetical protein n=1 Tax=unclassified Streptomyces TaxID=2593676 RepID=UPI0024B93427|nr:MULTISPECIES: hypothetical protein [unclassified Streptomyces]MDJ0345241.1 hypothetical protein [Streptomyces sp. PH10-H1]MDJ0368813.1 hypothetical protein [Streptomyces sp. H10-C2]